MKKKEENEITNRDFLSRDLRKLSIYAIVVVHKQQKKKTEYI